MKEKTDIPHHVKLDENERFGSDTVVDKHLGGNRVLAYSTLPGIVAGFRRFISLIARKSWGEAWHLLLCLLQMEGF